MSDFLQGKIGGKAVHRLGLAVNYGIDAPGLERALDLGINYIFYTALRTGPLLPTLQSAIKKDREKLVIATGPMFGYFPGMVRSGCEAALRSLGTDYLDIFQLYWLGISSAWTEGVVEELQKLREEGKVRMLGVSIHDRPRAGKLAEDSPLDMLMLRYNAAHPGAEREVFPHLARRQPAVVAYTATSWGRLLKRPSGWSKAMPTPADCYRFCLSSPHVNVTLCGPKNLAQLEENLSGLEKGPLNPEEESWMREFGRVVHG